MFNNIYNFAAINPSSTLAIGTVLTSRIICLIPAIEMAIRTINDLGEVIHSFSLFPKKLNIQAESLLQKEQEELEEKNLQEERWKNAKILTLTQDALGALFLGFCAFSPNPIVVGLGALTFLAYSKFNWQKEDASYSVKTTGLSLKILSIYKVRIIKALIRTAKKIITLVAKAIKKVGSVVISGIKQTTRGVVSVAKMISKIFKFAILGPIKICAKVVGTFVKHPMVGIALIGAVALGIIARQGTPLLRQLGAAVGTAIIKLANGMVTIGKAVLPTITKCAQVIFSTMFNVAKSLGPIAFMVLKAIPSALQLILTIIWKTFSTIIGGVVQLF